MNSFIDKNRIRISALQIDWLLGLELRTREPKGEKNCETELRASGFIVSIGY